MPPEMSLESSYDDFPRIEEEFALRLDESLHPRGPEDLYRLIDHLQGGRGLAIDVGCGEGNDSLRLASEFGFDVLGVDPVQRHVEMARAAATESGLRERVRFALGTAERLPAEDGSVSLVWCKEILMFADVPRALAEFARVLGEGGSGVIYQVFTGPQMTDDEANEFWGSPGATGAASLRPEDIEGALGNAGFAVNKRVDYGSEWGESGEEARGAAGRRLLHVARLIREPERYISEFGRENYEVMLTDCRWHVYRMIGKLHGAAFVFSAPG